ncbi:hypothetical protein G7Y89_g6090 [Cudoniella acicularis]|uniref:Peptidase M48 domain-containing protein n=1 Tax=Cudoniella acicularis TaxID=354080 RepID=A0A8H4W3C5_9HELO|nr:hypothetical protein G7Y89_g6090 [Cudoniella acicularis]
MFSRTLFRNTSRVISDSLPRTIPKCSVLRPTPRLSKPSSSSFASQRFRSEFRGPPPPPRRTPKLIHVRFNPEAARTAKPLVTPQQIRNWVFSNNTKWIVITIAGGSVLLIVTNIEEVPVSGRKRFRCLSDAYVEAESNVAYKALLAEFSQQGLILPPGHRLVRKVHRVMERLIEAGDLRNVNWEIHVIASDEANAMVLPGGKVFVFTGILPIAQTDDGLAAILGHEISHNIARHTAEQMSWLIPLTPVRWTLLFLDYTGYTGGLGRILGDLAMDLGLMRPASRKMESEADYIGLMLMAKACYDPAVTIALWERMDAAEKQNSNSIPQWLSTHPASLNRADMFRKWLPEAEGESRTDYIVTAYIAEFINTLTNLVYIYYAYHGIKGNSNRRDAILRNLPYLGIAAVGLGSGIFHATMKNYTQWCDDLSMLLAVATVTHRVFTFDKSITYTVTSGLILTTLMTTFSVWHCVTDELIMHSVLFGIMIAMVGIKTRSIIKARVSDPVVQRDVTNMATWGAAICAQLTTLKRAIGAGAVGAFYASRLAQVPNVLVSVICRSNYQAVFSKGFSVSSPKYGSYTFTPHQTFANPQQAIDSNIIWDYVLVSTKALPDVSDDSEILCGLLKEGHTSIVLVQNGLGVEEPYKKRFPTATVLSAVTIVSAAQTAHGIIKHNRWTRISIGPYLPGTTDTTTLDVAQETAIERNKSFVQLLQAGGIADAEEYSHAKLQMVRWHKIAINASMNPSAVLSGGSTNNAMSMDSELYLHLKGVMDEVLSTAPKVLGTPLPKELATPEAILRSTQKNTSGSKPSMLLDWEQGKKMELEVILGNPIRIAREHGLEMPRLQSLYALLRMAQENRERAKSESIGFGGYEIDGSKLE